MLIAHTEVSHLYSQYVVLIAHTEIPSRARPPWLSGHLYLRHVPLALSSIERVRTTLVELLVTTCMAETRVGHGVRVLESVPDREHIPQSMLQLALSLVNFAVGLPIPTLPCAPYGNTSDFVWMREDVCLRITTHLDDEDTLKASIGDLVHHMDTTPDRVGIIYGITFSIFHCAIVRVDKDEQGISFAHTSALQFLPSFYARTMFTPGIEALSRLGCQTSGVEFLNAISDSNNLPHLTHNELLVTGSVVAKIPVEVWSRIGSFITSPANLVTLASISARAMSAAADLTRFPLVDEYRLVNVISSGPVEPIPETIESTDQDHILFCYHSLGCAKFTAFRGGRRINVGLSQGAGLPCLGYQTFEVETYFEDPVVIMDNKLSILELDDNNSS